MTFRPASLLVLFLMPACGDDTSRGGHDVTHTSDVSFPDATTATTTTAADTSVASDTGTSDTDSADPSVTIADTSVVDTTVADTTVADTTVTTSEDATIEDTTIEDTSVADTSGPTCFTLPASHARFVVVARPYSEPDGDASDRWEVLPLLSDGALGKATDSFTMDRAGFGHVSFSADGALGAVATDNGDIDVFALSEAGKATVIGDGLDLGVYADSVQVAGDQLFIVDSNWQNNGGGIYVASFGCDGTLGAAHLLYATKNAYGLYRRADGKHLVAAKEAVDTTFGALALVSPKSASWERLATANPFDADAIISKLALTADGKFALVGDNQFFSETPNRVAAIAVDTNTLTTIDVLSPIEDPFDIVVSPMNDAVLVVTGYANDVRVLDYDATRLHPFIDMGVPDYVTQKPQLPADAILVGGAFPNLVFVTENQAIRRFQFEGNGEISDLGRTATAASESFELIPGALGVQP